MYTPPRRGAIPLLPDTVVSVTRSTIAYYKPWLARARGEPMRNPTLLALPSEGEEGVAIRGECLSMGSDKTGVAKAGQARQ
jgi:hypothetical protein